MSFILLFVCLINAAGAILISEGHPYIGHWCFLVVDPMLAVYAFTKGEYELMSLYLFFSGIAIKGIIYYHNKYIKEVFEYE